MKVEWRIVAATMILFSFGKTLTAQTNIVSTNTVAEQVMLGNYDPAVYAPAAGLNHPDVIIDGVNSLINADSLKSYLVKLGTFYNRNTGSDTVSPVKGIGAARRWVEQKFAEISSENSNRLLPSYLQFDRVICSAGQHRCPFAVLPGLDTSDASIIIIESHLDSRCETSCDTSCLAEGIDDNGSGTALVIELARVMSKFSYSHTIVFLANIAEEQGLWGAEAFADYTTDKGILIKSVQNNDVVGGILCGHTSSPPSCPGFGEIDSTQVRLFSQGVFNSKNKGLVRFIKLEYKENLLPTATVPMTISIMTDEDRAGRGGDHIPFRKHGYTAMRFTEANENGDASNDTSYADNQHTSRDVLGYDTDGDGEIDSFLVDFNYLKRNTQINANGAAMAAIGPHTPEFTYAITGSDLSVTITTETQYAQYRVGVRTVTNDFDSVYAINGTSGTIHLDSQGVYYVTVASVDTNGIESFFSDELNTTAIENISAPDGIVMLSVKPNPADDATMISFMLSNLIAYKEAFIRIIDSNGKMIQQNSITLQRGMNEVLYHHPYHQSGVYIAQLVIDDKIYASMRIVFGN